MGEKMRLEEGKSIKSEVCRKTACREIITPELKALNVVFFVFTGKKLVCSQTLDLVN